MQHERKEPFECNGCNACFATKPSLNKHIHEGVLKLKQHVKMDSHSNAKLVLLDCGKLNLFTLSKWYIDRI